MKTFPGISSCYNCNATCEVPTHSDGTLKVDGDENYLCARCRVNPNVKPSDYLNEIKCTNDSCENISLQAKRSLIAKNAQSVHYKYIHPCRKINYVLEQLGRMQSN